MEMHPEWPSESCWMLVFQFEPIPSWMVRREEDTNVGRDTEEMQQAVEHSRLPDAASQQLQTIDKVMTSQSQ